MSQVATSALKDEFAKILFVDDEPRVLNSMRAMFRREYRVWTANSAQDALDLLKRESVDVVVSDQRMPGMTGVEMLTQIKTLAPDTVRILLTGYADLTAIEASINEGEVFRYLVKPCPPDELRSAVALAIEASQRSDIFPLPVVEAAEVTSASSTIVSFPVSASVPVQQAEAESEPATVVTSLKIAEPEVSLPSASQQTSQQTSQQIVPEPNPSEASIELPTPGTYNDEFPCFTDQGRQTEPRLEHRVDLLVLTQDPALIEGICAANRSEYEIHTTGEIAEALRLLASNPIGVLVTDLATSEDEIHDLTSVLKQEVPELVTIIASDRSDATTLIQLINSGQIFRFLLKPVQPGQCRLWLNSAIIRYFEIADSPEALKRHLIAGVTSNSTRPAWLDQMKKGISSIRARLAVWKQRI